MEVFEMHFSPNLGSPITNTHLRSPGHVADVSGMCAVCTADCVGPCEIGLSAIRGSEAILPFSADKNQFASEKRYPLDFSHFNINGRVFGAIGLPSDPYEASYPNTDISSSFGVVHTVPVKAPFILPAMAKLAWKEYFAGAAIFGVPVVIGEDVIAKDKGLIVNGHKVIKAPLIDEMVSTFRRYEHGFGDIILQANFDDEYHGVLEYAIERLGIKSKGSRAWVECRKSRTRFALKLSVTSSCQIRQTPQSPRPMQEESDPCSRKSASFRCGLPKTSYSGLQNCGG